LGGGTFTLTSPTGNPATVEHAFILTNTGTPAAPTVSGSGPGCVFSLAAHDCNRVLAAGETCFATVRATYTTNVAAATGTPTRIRTPQARTALKPRSTDTLGSEIAA
jgi:hypothetical protein